ncbi:MAG TPA: urate hydroxylase PuuD [Steroidobacteraceae bacterium]|nr:urate hydroxylase PuuD [Steroidobacteraceae bacterium]
MNPLTTVKWPLIIGFVLAVVIAALVEGGLTFNSITLAALTRWLHIIFGIFWIGLLYYFNAVQTPGLSAAAADKGGPGGAGVNKYIAPRALLWFRWSALGTWLLGAYLLSQSHGRFISAFTLSLSDAQFSRPNLIIGIGAWLGTIMLFNVWGLIWPNQKKILGIVPATDEEKAKARKVALYASRTNFLLSVPMLMCMVGPMHGLPF